MNKIILIGRLTREPEMKFSQGKEQSAITRYSLAVNRKYTSKEGQQEADFINCIAFGKSAEFAEGRNSSGKGGEKGADGQSDSAHDGFVPVDGDEEIPF